MKVDIAESEDFDFFPLSYSQIDKEQKKETDQKKVKKSDLVAQAVMQDAWGRLQQA